MKLPAPAQVLIAVAIAAVLLLGVGRLAYVTFHHPEPAKVTPAVATAVNTATRATVREAKQTATVKEAVSNVKATSAASDDMGDTGRIGLAGLCKLRPYSETKPEACRVLGADTRGLEEAGGSR